MISFLGEQDQNKLIAGFGEQLKSRGLVILGRNEELSGDGWRAISNDPVSAFLRNA
jgi:purine-binding chemotaxis protein CheW